MTGSPVMMGAGMLGNQIMQVNTRNTKTTDFADFKSFMGQSQKKIDMISNDLHGQKAKPDSQNNLTSEVKTDDRVNTVKTVKTEKQQPDSKVTDSEVDQISEVIDEIKEVLKDKFGLSDEQIEEVLASLGLNQIALLDVPAVQEVIVEATEAEDALSIVTDENAYESLKAVNETIEDAIKTISEETGIPVEEIEEAVSNHKIANNVNKADDNEQFSLMNDDETVVNEETEDTLESKIFVISKDTDKKAVSFETKVEALEVTKEETKIDTDLRKSGKEEQNGSQNEAPMSFADNLFTKVAERLSEGSEQISYSSFDAQNIMNQITDFIKIDVSMENPEVSLRLHPETLGTVSVKISANNEGVLTAQFIAQNESVKAVIESQAMVLKENLESKGMNVEAVEVLVQSHAFERNLNERNNEQGNSNNSFAKKTRRINLIDETDTEEVQTEEDVLAKEMMIQNGNTVDYSA